VHRLRSSFLLRDVRYAAVSALVACVDGRYVCILCIQIPDVYEVLFDDTQAIGRGNAC
jgi:hypothetical protein